ncbi:hypothetical protein Pmar_PMAR020605, partial [Perkinsus marinus ATCC 50983]
DGPDDYYTIKDSDPRFVAANAGTDDYYTIKDSDLTFVAANAEDDACSLEVHLHDTQQGG